MKQQTIQILVSIVLAAATATLGGCGSRCPGEGPGLSFQNEGVPSPECTAYRACHDATGGCGLHCLPSNMDTCGSCWTTTAKAAAACTDACRSATVALKAAYPDAGC